MQTFNQLVNNTNIPVLEYNFYLRAVRRGGDWMDMEAAVVNLKDCTKVFNEHGVKSWLQFGTLLGAIRDGCLIPHDKDVDVGVFRKDTMLLVDVFKELCKDYNFEFIRNVCLDSTVSLMRNDEYIDFYVFNECAIWYMCVMIPEVCIFKDYQLNDLQTIRFLGMDFNVPKDYEDMFVKWYGDDWRVPIKEKSAYYKD